MLKFARCLQNIVRKIPILVIFGKIGFVCIFASTHCQSSLPIFDELTAHTAMAISYQINTISLDQYICYKFVQTVLSSLNSFSLPLILQKVLTKYGRPGQNDNSRSYYLTRKQNLYLGILLKIPKSHLLGTGISTCIYLVCIQTQIN